ncbi:MAG: hypothetical protein OES24_17370 [Acidimicrobiia bacterium]|nr:hypothetical protein [Acidimicrobiia bacterium]
MIVGYMMVGYLDAGTGSLILQTVLGGAAGLAVFFKTAGRRFLPSRGKSERAIPVSERPVEEVTES